MSLEKTICDPPKSVLSDRNETVFREWAPMNYFIEKIPPKFHQGFASKELLLTCVTCSNQSIVLGSNAGVAFWFDRHSEKVARKSISDRFLRVTALAITSGSDGENLAVGNVQGMIAIFSSKQLGHSPICIMPQGPANAITSLEWDGNGVYLLSGDEQGTVQLSKFQSNLLQPVKIIVNDNTAIVQLKFHPVHRNTDILISSLQRTQIAKIDNQGKVVLIQVGRKDRKTLAPYGADYGLPQGSSNDPLIYSSRPGLRLWLSDCQQGAVQQTLIFKDSPSNLRSKLILLSFREEYANVEPQFGPVFSLGNGLVVTYSCTSLFILDTGFSSSGQVSVLNYCRFAKNLQHLTVFNKEIFLLLDNRTLIRVSNEPDRRHQSRPTTPLERPLIATGWKDKIPTDISKSVKPSFQSTISKLTSRISDVEKSGPFMLESLTNALAPIFSSNKPSPTCSRHNSPVHLSRSLSLNELAAALEPSVLTPILKSSSPVNGDLSNSSSSPTREESPIPKYPTSKTTPCGSGDEEPVEEELVYASYIGKKRKLKLTRKTNCSLSAPVLSAVDNGSSAGDQVASLAAGSHTQVPVDFLEELERKNQLLAKILQLDQVAAVDELSADEPALEASQVDGVQSTTLSHSSSPSAPSPSPEEPSNPIEHVNDCPDDIYSKYAEEEKGGGNIFEPATSLKTANSSVPRFKSSPVPSLSESVSSTATHSKWQPYTLPGTQQVTNMVSCRHYTVVIDSYKNVYYQSTDVSSLQSDVWQQVDVAAQQICTSQCGKHLWRLNKGSVFQGLGVSLLCPVARSWDMVANQISWIGLVKLHCSYGSGFFVWMLHSNGTTVSVHAVESPKQPTFIQTPGCVSSMCSCNNRVLIVLDNGKLYHRLNIDHETPIGLRWQWIMTPDLVTSAVLGPDGQIWIWARSEALYYLDAASDSWFQVVVDKRIHSKSDTWFTISSLFKRRMSEMWLVTVQNRICLAISNCDVLLTSDCLKGYAWSKVETANNCNRNNELPLSWRLLNCSAVYQDIGVCWLVDRQNRLHCCYDGRLENISLPTESEISVLAVAPQYLWLLTAAGEVFIRAGQSHPIGTGWVELSTLQFAPRNQLCHVALAPGSAWACDVHGQVYFRLGDNGPPTLLSPAWSLVDDGKIPFKKICTGTSDFMVWGIDTEHNIYVRDGIRPDFLIGTSWIKIPGLKATQIAISEYSAWILAPGGTIHRRYGVLDSNVAGDAWETIPGNFVWITVTIDDILWAVNAAGSIFKLNTTQPFTSLNGVGSNSDDFLNSEEDWVLV